MTRAKGSIGLPALTETVLRGGEVAEIIEAILDEVAGDSGLPVVKLTTAPGRIRDRLFQRRLGIIGADNACSLDVRPEGRLVACGLLKEEPYSAPPGPTRQPVRGAAHARKPNEIRTRMNRTDLAHKMVSLVLTVETENQEGSN